MAKITVDQIVADVKRIVEDVLNSGEANAHWPHHSVARIHREIDAAAARNFEAPAVALEPEEPVAPEAPAATDAPEPTPTAEEPATASEGAEGASEPAGEGTGA